MAHSIVVTKLVEGAKDVIFSTYLKCDGTSGEISNYVLIDPKVSLTPALSAKSRFTITELWYDMTGFILRFAFDDLNKFPVWTPTATGDNHICFDKFGGLKDRSGLDGTGKVLFTTVGFDSANKEGSFVIKVRKN